MAERNAEGSSPDWKPFSHAELRELPEERLLDMLFEGRSDVETRVSQAAHELSRRQQWRAFKLQMLFAALATLAAVSSAIAAWLSLKAG